MNGPSNLWSIDARAYFLGVILCLTLIFTSLNPEGSGGVTGISLLFLWFLQTAIPIGLLVLLHMTLSRLSAFDHCNPWIKIGLSGMLGALAFSPIALGLDVVFGIEVGSILQDPHSLFRAWVAEITGVGPPIVLVWFAINAPYILHLNFSPTSEDGETDSIHERSEESDEKMGLFNLLPQQLDHNIIYIESELHYVRVVTEKDEALVLYALKDAIADLEHINGIQIHRSYWVALDYIKRLRRKGTQWEIELKNQMRLPVSRRRAASVRHALTEAGLVID